MNVNEYGVVFAFYVAYPISDFTTLSIAFTKPDGSILNVTSPAVSAPATPLTTPAGVFPASQYALYTFIKGDVDVAGDWSARVTYNVTGSPNEQLISGAGTFVVNP